MRLKTYWHIISQLFTSPEYYLKILRAPFWMSVRFFTISMIALGLTWAWRINQIIIPISAEQVSQGLDELENNYPAELEIIWDENKLSSSAPEAIGISYPNSMEQNSQFPPLLGNFIPTDISSEQFSAEFEQTSLLVITTDKLYVNNLQGVWSDVPLSDVLPTEKIVLNKDTVPELVSKSKQQLEKVVDLVKKLNFLIAPLVLITIRLWMSFLEAILVFLFFKLNQLAFKFKKVFQFSLHLTVVSEIIAQVTSWIYPDIQISMLTLSYWSIFSYVFWTQRKHFSKLKG